jgi:hypothetical protein
MPQEEGFKFCLDTRSNRAFPWLVYFNIVIASNVQLCWFMRFAIECFKPYPLTSNSFWFSIWLGAIVMKYSNTKCHWGWMNKKNLTFMKWLSLKIKSNCSKPTYLIGFNYYLPTYLSTMCEHFISHKLDDLDFIN